MTNHYRHNYVGHTLNNKDILAIPVEAIANTAHTFVATSHDPFHKKAYSNAAYQTKAYFQCCHIFFIPIVTHNNKDF